MDSTIKQLIYDAQLITKMGGANSDEALVLRMGVLRWAGYDRDEIKHDTWDEYIPKMPDSIRDIMIAFDDTLNYQDSKGLMYNL